MSTPNISTNIYLPLFVIFLVIILLCGCTPAGLHYGDDTQRNPSKPEALYLGYQGARLHQSQIATLWWNNTPGVVEEINGNSVNRLDGTGVSKWGAELLPGKYTIKYYICSPRLKGSGCNYIDLEANLAPGHIYEFKTTTPGTTNLPCTFTVALVDTASGNLVAGRTPDVYKWSWGKLESVLEELQRKSATKQKVKELFSKPHPYVYENTLVYTVSKSKPVICCSPLNRTGFLHTEHDKSVFGLLFLEFGESGGLQNYTFVEAPFYQCNRFWKWDWETAWKERDSCLFRLERLSYAEFRIKTNNPLQAYYEIERGLTKKGKKSEQRSNELLQHSHIFLEQHPEVLSAAKASFSNAAFEDMVNVHGDEAEDTMRNRLVVYEKLANPNDYHDAVREFSAFFKKSLRQ
jgi:hypothetical protein